MEERFRTNYGVGLRVPDLFDKLPHLDDVDPELMFDIFHRGKELCIEEGVELTGFHLMHFAKRAMLTDFRQVLWDASRNDAMNQLMVSLLEPGLEVMRYLPRIAERLGLNVDREFKPLWEYIEPDFMTRLMFPHWNIVSHMLDDLPQLTEELSLMPEKPTFNLIGNQKDHGTTATILGDNIKLSIRGNLDEHDVLNAVKFAGNLGPEILATTDRWILEEYFDYPKIESYDMHATQDSFTYGTLLGSALSQIHKSGYSYNSSLYDRVSVNPATNQLHITDWCYAREDNDTEKDFDSVKKLLKSRYLGNLDHSKYPRISSFGTQPYIQARKGFYEGYSNHHQVNLSSVLK